jgi:hypothetical protein
VRVYLAATPAIFAADLAATAPLPPGPAFAPTDALARALGEDDPELVEYAAYLAAADACLTLMRPGRPLPRVVISAEAAPCQLLPAPAADADPPHPAAVTLAAPLRWSDALDIHVDDQSAIWDITAAIGVPPPDPAAADRLADRDLLWYDPSERHHLAQTPELRPLDQ